MTLAVLGATAQNAVIEELRVMTFNVYMGGMNAAYDVAPYANFINREQPDIVSLQEIDHYTARNGYRDFCNTLAEKTGMFALFVKAIDYRGGYYGNVLLSKYPILGLQTVVKQYQSTTEPRTGVIADILMPSGQILQMCATHLEVSSEEARLELLIDLLIRMQKRSEYPAIMAGDFNSREYSTLITAYMSSWNNLSGVGFTVSLPTPTICIDYVFGYPKTEWSVSSSKVYTSETVSGNGGDSKNNKLLSDHAPVMAVMSYRPNVAEDEK